MFITFTFKLETWIQTSSEHCSTIILWDFTMNISEFNILWVFTMNILECNNLSSDKQQLFNFMCRFNLKWQFYASTVKVGSQLDHIWSNLPNIGFNSNITKAYQPDVHKPIYIAFEIINTHPIFTNKQWTSLVIQTLII